MQATAKSRPFITVTKCCFCFTCQLDAELEEVQDLAGLRWRQDQPVSRAFIMFKVEQDQIWGYIERICLHKVTIK